MPTLNNKLILLDCDGVLYPTEQIPPAAFSKALAETFHFLDITDTLLTHADAIRRKSGYFGLYNRILFATRAKNIPFRAAARFFIKRIDYSGLIENTDLAKKIMDLHQKIPCAIATNNHPVHLDIILKTVLKVNPAEWGIPLFDISSFFDGTGFISKRRPDYFKSICSQLNVTPEQTTLYDDTPDFLENAHKAGLKTCLISTKNPLDHQINFLLNREKE